MKDIFPVSVDKISSKIAGFINKNKGAQRALQKVGDNPALFSAVTAFGLASVVKPAILGAMPFKNKKDKACSQATSIASGLTELAATAAIFIPLNKGISKASEVLLSSKGTIFENNKMMQGQFKSLTNRCARLLFLVPINILRTKMIKPLMKNIFEKRKLDTWA